MQVGEKPSDAQLVHRFLAGDNSALSLLYVQYEPYLFSYTFKKMQNREDAQDIVQETFVEVSQHLWRLKEPEKFSYWMFGIASQLIAKEYRERRKQVECIPLSYRTDEVIALDNASILAHRCARQRSANHDLGERFDMAIKQLPDSEKKPFLLRKEGKHYREIAQVLGITEGAVKHRLFRARKKLKILVFEPEAGKSLKSSHSKDSVKFGEG